MITETRRALSSSEPQTSSISRLIKELLRPTYGLSNLPPPSSWSLSAPPVRGNLTPAVSSRVSMVLTYKSMLKPLSDQFVVPTTGRSDPETHVGIIYCLYHGTRRNMHLLVDEGLSIFTKRSWVTSRFSLAGCHYSLHSGLSRVRASRPEWMCIFFCTAARISYERKNAQTKLWVIVSRRKEPLLFADF